MKYFIVVDGIAIKLNKCGFVEEPLLRVRSNRKYGRVIKVEERLKDIAVM